jgi:cytoskeletal protein RodZ
MAKHKQEDPWAGFVDVLSSILMVVIFLVVILGVAIFAMSQQITKVAVDQAIQAEREKQESAPKPKPAAKPEPTPKPEAGAEDLLAAGPKDAPPKSVEKDEKTGTDGEFEPAPARQARQLDPVTGKTKMAVRSLATPETKEIEIAAEEIVTEEVPAATIVKTAHALLSLKFKAGSYKINPSSSEEICKSLTSEITGSQNMLEVRANVTAGGVETSDARRIAYYRGMQTRGELVKCGISEARIAMRIRAAGLEEENEVVQVFLKP